jgi:hypothetical protein
LTNNSKKNNLKIDKSKLTPEEKFMICPYCNQEMRPGYLNTGRTRILFSTKDRWDTEPKQDDILLRRLWRKTGPSFYCKNCNLIITKLEKKDGE